MEQESATNQGDQTQKPVEHIRNDWRALVDTISYKGIVNNLLYLSFIVLLCVVYISSNQRAIDEQRRLNKKNEELKELRWKYMDIKSQLLTAGMETEVIRNASIIGLKPMELPAYKIELDSNRK